MSEQFIFDFIPRRISEMGYNEYNLRYRDFVLEENSIKTIFAYNSLYFISGDPQGIIIESDYGVYDTLDYSVENNIHQHKGEIIISNLLPEKKRIKFIQVILIS